jgi:hypothetical protein
MLFPNARYIMFGQSVPAFMMPLISLLITQLLVPNASLIGHSGGILAGLILGLLLRFGARYRGQSFVMVHNLALFAGSLGTWLVIAAARYIKLRAAALAAAAGSSGGRGGGRGGPQRYEGGSGAIGHEQGVGGYGEGADAVSQRYASYVMPMPTPYRQQQQQQQWPWAPDQRYDVGSIEDGSRNNAGNNFGNNANFPGQGFTLGVAPGQYRPDDPRYRQDGDYLSSR